LVRTTANANNDFLTPSERAFHIRKCLEGTQSIIDYEETKDLNCSLSDMLKQVAEMCSYGKDFELTK